MKAGRELDMLVAEKVYGWTLPNHPDTNAFRKELYETRGMIDTRMGDTGIGFNADGSRALMIIPHHSTDIADAWLVWLEMKKRNWFAFFDALRAIAAPAGTAAYDWLYTLSPELICLAALKSIGINASELEHA